MPEMIQHHHKIYYETHGEGTPLILIRGLGSSADHWYTQVPELSKHFRVIIFDNRGIARSTDSGEPFTIQDMAQDTIELLDHLGIQRTHLLGLSMGGMIAQEIAIQHPHRINGLILAVTHCGGDQQIKAAADVTETIQRLAIDNSLEARVMAATVFFAPQTLKENAAALQAYSAASLKYTTAPEMIKRQMQAISTHATFDRLHRIKAPTLVLGGAEDVLIPPHNSNILSEQIPNAKLLIVPGGGHQVLIEQADACNQEIIAFLQQVEAAT